MGGWAVEGKKRDGNKTSTRWKFSFRMILQWKVPFLQFFFFFWEKNLNVVKNVNFPWGKSKWQDPAAFLEESYLLGKVTTNPNIPLHCSKHLETALPISNFTFWLFLLVWDEKTGLFQDDVFHRKGFWFSCHVQVGPCLLRGKECLARGSLGILTGAPEGVGGAAELASAFN